MTRLLATTAVLLALASPAHADDLAGFDPASVPERLRVLEGRTAYIKIPPQDEAPLYAAQGAMLRGNVPAQVVTQANTGSIPIELMRREREFDRFVLGHISEDELVAFIDEQSSTTDFVLLEDGAAVRIIAPRVDDGFATQVLPLTGHMSEAEGGVHLWVSSCFLRFGSAVDQELLNRGTVCR
jgi:hypothetical protein